MIKSGYKIFPDSVSKKANIKLFNFLVKVCQFYAPDLFEKRNYKGMWRDKDFNKKLILLRKKNKKKFSAIYDSIVKSSILYNFCYENKLDLVASKFLQTNKDFLTVRNLMLRMDVPNDKRNLYGWHQDSAYDNYNTYSKNGVVIWLPLINMTKKNGTLIVKPESQNENNVSSIEDKKGTKFSSRQLIIKNKFLKKYKTKTVNIKRNSALVTYSGLFHKSGNNCSGTVKFVFIARFNKILSKDFIHYRESYNS